MTSTDRRLLEARDTADEALPANADVPLLRGAQRQGDVLVLPVADQRERLAAPKEAAAIPAEGVVVVRGEADGDGHLLLGDGTWSPSVTTSDLGVVHVVTEAYLIHPEHGALGLAAGEYRLRRQREHTTAGPRPLAD